MRTDCWKPLFCACLLLPATAIADDTFDKLYESRWQLNDSAEAAIHVSESTHPTPSFDVDVEDGNSILRVAKIRSLSLFTLAEDEQSKWFFGINEDGFVGIHFRGFSRSGAKRHLDVASLLSADEDAGKDETD